MINEPSPLSIESLRHKILKKLQVMGYEERFSYQRLFFT